MVKVSVIVPVYNQEKYIERCIDSILAQSLHEIEVILVDDGSTDSTPDILRRYQQNDERIIILHQQNQYAGVARNHGLKAAQGEYVIFWDSDDYFSLDALEALYNESKKYDADICVGETTKMDMYDGSVKEHCYLNWSRLPEKRPFNVNDFPEYIFNFGINCPWNKIYKRAFVEKNKLQFSSLKHANDVYFVMKAFVLAEKITVVDKNIVFYQFRNAGSLSCNSLNNKESILKAFLEVKDFLKESGYWENEKIRQSFVNKAFSSLAARFPMFDDREEFKILYNYQKKEVLPALGIGEACVEQMYSEKNAYDLSHMLSCDAEEYIFKQYVYYQNKTQLYRGRTLRMKSKLEKANDKNVRQNEKILNLKQEKENKIEIIKKQREKIETRDNKIQRQIEKIKKQSEKIERQNEKIQRQGEKIEKQSEKIEKQSEKISSQKALLETKPVKVALKIHSLYS